MVLPVVFQCGSYSLSDYTVKFNAVHISSDDEVVHQTRAGKTQRLAGSAFEARPQREMFAFDLLHRQLPHRVLRRRKMPLIDTRLVRVISGDAQGGVCEVVWCFSKKVLSEKPSP